MSISENPTLDSATSILLVNGYIHNTVDPYATALHIDHGTIAWLGSEESAEATITRMSGGQAPQVIDLDGALVTPAFIDALGPESATNPHVADEVSDRQLVGVIADREAAPNAAGERNDITALYYAPAGLAEDPTSAINTDQLAGRFLPADADLDVLVPAADAPAPTTVTQFLIEIDSVQRLEDVLTRLEHLKSNHPEGSRLLMRARHRLWLANELSFGDDTVQRLRDTQVSVVVTPPAAGSGEAADFAVPVSDLLAAGVHVTTGSRQAAGELWAAITTLIEHPDPDQRIATRAAFNTAARDGARVLPNRLAQQFMTAGQIRVGAPAELAIWRAEQLGVQVPDEDSATRGHWSTDARAGSALLPILSSTSATPQLVARSSGPAGLQYR